MSRSGDGERDLLREVREAVGMITGEREPALEYLRVGERESGLLLRGSRSSRSEGERLLRDSGILIVMLGTVVAGWEGRDGEPALVGSGTVTGGAVGGWRWGLGLLKRPLLPGC